MAYSYYLIKLGNTAFDNHLIKAESYKITRNKMQKSAKRDSTGLLHLKTLSHRCVKIEFETVDGITNTELKTILDAQTAAMTDVNNEILTIDYYDFKSDGYKTAKCYIPDPEITIDYIDGTTVHYNPVRFCYIEL